MISQALQIAALAPNMMIKLPGSKEGYEAIEFLTSKGIATEQHDLFAFPQYLRCMEAVSDGLKIARKRERPTSVVGARLLPICRRASDLWETSKHRRRRGA